MSRCKSEKYRKVQKENDQILLQIFFDGTSSVLLSVTNTDAYTYKAL